MRGRLVIFVREPQAGRVKSRLARDIGRIEAAWWYRHQLQRLIRRVGHDPRWETVLAVTPDRAAVDGRGWPAAVTRVPQGAGDLGQRMARALRWGRGPVLVIGSDIPGVTAARVAGAFALLGTHDAVIGPATDGGYWAVGLRAGAVLPQSAFRDVRWSCPHARSDTERSLVPLTIGHAAELADVDCAADLVRAGRR